MSSGCDEYGDFKYCTVKDIYIFGDNTTVAGNALISGHKCPETILIPIAVNGKYVTEIGRYSLSGVAKNVKIIKIKARITQINANAFYEASSLEQIYLPNTLRYLFSNAIHVWNRTLGEEVTNPGVTQLFFEKGSDLKYIAYQGISYRAVMIIYTYDVLKPQTLSESFKWTKSLVVASPAPFSIGSSHWISLSRMNSFKNIKTCKFSRRTHNALLMI